LTRVDDLFIGFYIGYTKVSCNENKHDIC